MYSEKNLVHILTILEAIEKAFIYSEDIHNADDFWLANDQMNFNACVSLLIAIGEESKKIDENLKNEYDVIQWKAIAGMRNILAHHYRGIDPGMAWDIIINDLPQLKKVTISMLPKLEYPKDMLLTALDSEYYKHLDYLKEM